MFAYAVVAVLVGGSVPTQSTPDQVHLLKAADGRPNIELVLDSSGSMKWGGPESGSPVPVSECTSYWSACSASGAPYACNANSTNSGGVLKLVKTDQLKALLTGCTNATDGILDKWHDRVQFAVREFGGARTWILPGADFGANLTSLELAVRGLPASGDTPLTPAHALAAQHMHTNLNATNTRDCRQNYVLLLTDGDGNSGDNFVAYDWECHGTEAPVTSADVSWADPSEGAAYIYRRASNDELADNLCDPALPSSQSIGTYAIGFYTGIMADNNLTNVAEAGGGAFYSATNYASLDHAFNEIITSIVGRSAVNFQGGNVANDGVLQGNWIYVSPWSPSTPGQWVGNTRKYELFPFDSNGQFDATRDDTFFVLDGTELVVNGEPRDVWSGQTGGAARIGGVASKINDARGGLGSSPPGSPYTRNIKTWKANQPFADYLKFGAGTGGLSPDDTWSSSFCDHMRLVNYIHGYTYDVSDCAACNAAGDAGCAPVANAWPIGASVDSPTVLVKYAADCESASGRCFLVTGTLGGTLEIYDAYSGDEVAAIVPGELLNPMGAGSGAVTPIANDYLRDIYSQPNLDAPVRFYVDGGVRLYHDDQNGNGYIDGSESANIIFSLGRGGRETILIPVRAGFDGNPTVAAGNQPRVLAPFDEPADTAYVHLQDLWASPASSELRISGQTRPVVGFGSGHMRSLDAPRARMGGSLPLMSHAQPNFVSVIPDGGLASGCAAFMQANGLSALMCDPIAYAESLGLVSGPLTPCTPCEENSLTPTSCGAAPYCYDWPGYGLLEPSLAPPHAVTTGPMAWHDAAGNRAVAFRFRFDRLDLQDDDCVLVQNGEGRTVQSFCGVGVAQWTDWVYGEQVRLQFLTDGHDTSAATGFAISDVEVVLEPPAMGACVACDADGNGACSGAEVADAVALGSLWCDVDGDGECSGVECGPSVPTTPGVYVMDLETWADSGDVRDALLMRFAKECGTGPRWGNEVCYDATTSPDLNHMIFPISAEVSRLEDGGVLRAWYVGDEGGQIWKFYYDVAATDWRARRLAHFNNDGVSAASKDFRKIFTKLELVHSTCNGARSVGLYGGTGNIQRASEFDNIQNPAVTTPPSGNAGQRDILFVVWDSEKMPAGGTNLDLMYNVTDLKKIDDPTQAAVDGYFIELLDDEKLLRNALVFGGVAFFKTYQPSVGAEECVSASGLDRAYAFDNCTAEAVADGNGNGATGEVADRAVWQGSTDIGNPLQLFAPKGMDPFVSVLDQNTENAAAILSSKQFRKGLSLVLFRLL
ncbi:MAG: hypothetical protein IPK13_05940 [Deltaproteobacteria bacterium]|nr:hypothetical protein [Deltaproteobacteria bacterium]